MVKTRFLGGFGCPTPLLRPEETRHRHGAGQAGAARGGPGGWPLLERVPSQLEAVAGSEGLSKNPH